MAHVLIAGMSVRAIAEQMRRTGHEVTAIDAFGDADLRAAARTVIRCHPFSAYRAAQLAQDIACDAVMYTAPFENDPDAVALLTHPYTHHHTHRRALWSNSPDVLARVRDPVLLADTLTRLGFATPAVRTTAPRRGTREAARQWLLKPRHSGGGHDIVPWYMGDPVPRTHILQRRVRGYSGSVLFAAYPTHVVRLGITRQLIGDRNFGATGFRYTGSIYLCNDGPIADRAGAMAVALTESFALRGLNGIDFIARNGEAYAIEVNPRFTAPMELLDRPARHTAVVGKAVVYARATTRVGDTASWLADDTVRDIPMPGTIIPRGTPICTVFAAARHMPLCYRQLVARAAEVYASPALRDCRIT